MASESEIREEILVQLEAVRPGSREASRIARCARSAGVEMNEAECNREADYLAGKGLVERIRDEADPSVKRWKITPAGVDYLAEKGLA